MNGRTYTPNPGSVPGRVVAFFRSNADEELGVDDIMEKFDATRGNVHTLLSAAMDARLVRRERNDDGDYIYKAGTAISPGVTADPVTPKPTAVAPKKKRTPLDIDPAAVQLAAGVPVPGPKAPPPRKKIDWNQLLDRMAPGHSAVLPIVCRATLGKAIGLIHKEPAPEVTAEGEVYAPRKFVVRCDKDASTLRVWREA